MRFNARSTSCAADAAPSVGFRPALDVLNVNHSNPQLAAAGLLAEGVALATEGGTVRLEAGTYAETITLAKSLTLTT